MSDFAGVVVVAVVAAVVLGPRTGLLGTAGGFFLLKTVPGVAELASPLLGGVTSRDRGDLLAIVVLLPLAWFLRSHGTRQARALDKRASRWRTMRSRAVRTAGLIAAGGIVTATSCGPGPAVTEVFEADGQLFVLVDRGWGDSGWAASDDGGGSWVEGPIPSGRRARPQTEEPFADPGATGPIEACGTSGSCYRLVDRRAIERRPPGGEWREELRITEDEFAGISTGCAGGQRGVLASVAVTENDESEHVVATFGAAGVVVRGDEGKWRSRGCSARASATDLQR